MSTITAGTTSGQAIVVNGDTTGNMVLRVNNTTVAVTFNTDGSSSFSGDITTTGRVNLAGALGVGSSPSYGTAGQFLTSAGSGAAPTWTTLVSGAEPFVLFVNGGNTSPGDPQSALGII